MIHLSHHNVGSTFQQFFAVLEKVEIIHVLLAMILSPLGNLANDEEIAVYYTSYSVFY